MRTPSCLALLAIVLPSCFSGPVEDAGDVAFVHRVIPVVLGRKPRGSAEVDVLVDRLQTGRTRTQLVTDLIAANPEDYVDYWGAVLTDALRVQRSGTLPQRSECWDAPLVTGDLGASVVQDLDHHLVTADPSVPFDGGAFNMTDVVRASLVDDDLSPAVIANLPTLVTATKRAEYGGRAAAARLFTEAYLARRTPCVPCHSSQFSVVGAPSGFDRHATSPYALEAGVYGSKDGSSAPTAAQAELFEQYTEGKALYVANCGMCHAGAPDFDDMESLADLDGVVGNDYGAEVTLASRVTVMLDDQIRSQIRNGGGNMAEIPLNDPRVGDNWDAAWPPPPAGATYGTENDRVESILSYLRYRGGGGPEDLSWYFREGTADSDAALARPWGMSADCSDAIVERVLRGRPAWFAQVLRESPDVLDLSVDLRDGLATLGPEVDSAPAVTDPLLLERPPGDTAFGYLVVQALADDFAEELTGSRLTVEHGFSRNTDQADLALAMIQRMLVEDQGRTRVSLKELLTWVAGADVTNVVAPADSSLATAYWAPMVANPWAASDPRDPASARAALGADANGVGDIVHRYSPNNLLRSVGHTLGWHEPRLFPDESAYPSAGLVTSIGGFRSEDQPGTVTWDFQSLLRWEAEVGRCQKPPDQVDPDWIDALAVAADEAVAAPDPGLPPVLVEDLFLATRDRILEQPEFADSDILDERQVLNDLLAGPYGWVEPDPLGLELGALSAAQKAEVEAAVRDYCGALLTSPQYVMAGIPVVTAATALEPRLVVCLPGEECTKEDLGRLYPGGADDELRVGGGCRGCDASTAASGLPWAGLLVLFARRRPARTMGAP